MNKKNIINKLKSEKGISGVDVAVAITILVMAVVVVTMIYVNINTGNKSINRTAGATKLATNILENIQLTDYENIVSLDTKNGAGNRIYNTKVPNGYHAIVTVTEGASTDIFYLVKNVTVEIKYKISGEEKNIKVSTAVEEKYKEECNPPKFTEKFLINSPDTETKQLSSKVIVPIKYSYVTDKYVVTTESDKEWYNYSSKEWAKILVFPDNIVKSKFMDSNGNIITDAVVVSGASKKFTDYLYVWIPNFGLAANGNYYFRSGTKGSVLDKNALVFSKVKTADGKILNAYTVDTSIIFSNAIIMNDDGYWRLYKETPTTNTLYEQLNLSVYGPVTIHK